MEKLTLDHGLRFKRKKKKNIWDTVFIITMLIVPLIVFFNQWVFINFNSILMAFQLPTGAWSLDSMREVFTNIREGAVDPNFSITLAFKNSMIWFFISVALMPFQLLIAYFIYKRIKGYKFFQVIFYLPSIISGVVLASAYSSLIEPSGPVGLILQRLGVNPVPNFLADSDYTMGALIIYRIWLAWGGNMLLYGGAMARIPLEVLESARLDGAGSFKEFASFIIPLVWPTTSTLLILNLTGIFSTGDVVMLFTQGSYRTMTLGYWIYHKSLYGGSAEYNVIAATGLLFTVITVPVVMFVRWLLERIPTVEY